MTREINAYRYPRKLGEGCQHFQGRCRCDPPYWLRASTPAEEAHEARMRCEPVELDEAQNE